MAGPTRSFVAFVCCDCGVHITAFAKSEVPVPPRCCLCEWIVENVDPSDYDVVHEQLQIRAKH